MSVAHVYSSTCIKYTYTKIISKPHVTSHDHDWSQYSVESQFRLYSSPDLCGLLPDSSILLLLCYIIIIVIHHFYLFLPLVVYILRV